MTLPKKCLVDTNVPKTANLAIQPDPESDVTNECIMQCIEAIQHVTKHRCLIVDSGNEIFDEYRNQLSMSGEPGVGDVFMKWVHDNRWKLHYSQRIDITKKGDTYEEFPLHDGLQNFDISDRKFIAVAYTYIGNADILQATDSKWWGWKDALDDVGITVHFLCSAYVQAKFFQKMEE